MHSVTTEIINDAPANLCSCSLGFPPGRGAQEHSSTRAAPQIMDWASTWKAVCIAWQQGPVQQIVQCLQHADSDGLTEGAQDLFSNAMSL